MDAQTETVVYVLTNPSMPGLIKIGRTDRDVEDRLDQLYTTGVPVPFECYYACRVEASKGWEGRLHRAFENSRVNPKREFFELEPDQAKIILEALALEDVTPAIAKRLASQSDEVDKASSKRLERRRRPPINFDDMAIPVGAILQYVEGEHEVTVSGPRKVIYNGAELSLTRVTSDILDRGYAVQPTPYWTYEGRNLSDIYEETYTADF